MQIKSFVHISLILIIFYACDILKSKVGEYSFSTDSTSLRIIIYNDFSFSEYSKEGNYERNISGSWKFVNENDSIIELNPERAGGNIITLDMRAEYELRKQSLKEIKTGVTLNRIK